MPIAESVFVGHNLVAAQNFPGPVVEGEGNSLASGPAEGIEIEKHLEVFFRRELEVPDPEPEREFLDHFSSACDPDGPGVFSRGSLRGDKDINPDRKILIPFQGQREGQFLSGFAVGVVKRDQGVGIKTGTGRAVTRGGFLDPDVIFSEELDVFLRDPPGTRRELVDIDPDIIRGRIRAEHQLEGHPLVGCAGYRYGGLWPVPVVVPILVRGVGENLKAVPGGPDRESGFAQASGETAGEDYPGQAEEDKALG